MRFMPNSAMACWPQYAVCIPGACAQARFMNAISRMLNDAGIPAKHGGIWYDSTIENILRNQKYQGDLLLQKQFRLDHLSKKDCPNRGELPQYFVDDKLDAGNETAGCNACRKEVQP